MVCNQAKYRRITKNNLAVIPDAPEQPDLKPNISRTATPEQRSAAEYEWHAKTHIYNEYMATEDALKKVLLETVDRDYLWTHFDQDIGFKNVPLIAILTTLQEEYGPVDLDTINKNRRHFEDPVSPEAPLEELFTHEEACISTAALAEDPITKKLPSTTLYILKQTGVYPEAVKEFGQLSSAEKTMKKLKTNFLDVQKSRLENKEIETAGSHGFANLAVTDELAIEDEALRTQNDENRAQINELTAAVNMLQHNFNRLPLKDHLSP